MESSFLKIDTNELIYKAETDLRISKQTYGYRKQKYAYLKGRHGRAGMNQELGMNTYPLLRIRQEPSKGLLYSTGNSAQCSVTTSVEKI